VGAPGGGGAVGAVGGAGGVGACGPPVQVTETAKHAPNRVPQALSPGQAQVVPAAVQESDGSAGPPHTTVCCPICQRISNLLQRRAELTSVGKTPPQAVASPSGQHPSSPRPLLMHWDPDGQQPPAQQSSATAQHPDWSGQVTRSPPGVWAVAQLKRGRGSRSWADAVAACRIAAAKMVRWKCILELLFFVSFRYSPKADISIERCDAGSPCPCGGTTSR
jgi:hypothetical protein